MPELLLPLGRHFFQAEKLSGLGKARAGHDRGPQSRIVRAELPRGGAAHAEAAHRDAVLVDGVGVLDGVERFKEIDLAGEAVGVTEAAIKMKDDGVARHCHVEAPPMLKPRTAMRFSSMA